MRNRGFSADQSWQEARKGFIDTLKKIGYFQELPREEVDVKDALDRIAASDITALIPAPHYRAAAMDGAVLRAKDTSSASEFNPVVLFLGQDALLVNTGDYLPPEFDSIVKIEEIPYYDNSVIHINKPVVRGSNVRPVGEDFAAGEILVPAGSVLTPYDLGAILSAGIIKVSVYARPKVAILPTGTEIVAPTPVPAPGEIIESNGTMLAGLVKQWGGEPHIHTITPDHFHLLKASLSEAVSKNDIVLVIAGSSLGKADYTLRLIEESGRVLTRGIAMKPGKPVILGVIDNKPVIGVPGFPVAAALCAELFVKPLVYYRQGTEPPCRRQVKAVLSCDVPSPFDKEEFVRVKLERQGNGFRAAPLPRRSSAILSLSRAHGVVIVPRCSEGCAAGEEVTVYLLRAIEEDQTYSL